MSNHPYKNLPESSYWAPAVGQRNMFDIDSLWSPKFAIGAKDQVATFGSCFAQHISRGLKANGLKWLNAEPGPDVLDEAEQAKFNYGIFSARTGNIYTASLLHQWARWAASGEAEPAEIWTKDGRFYDPFRPNIEALGFASEAEMRLSRTATVKAFLRCMSTADVFVFTFGLTESWFNRAHGYEYPLCPGTVAGDFDAEMHEFVNQDYNQIRREMVSAIKLLRTSNPAMRILLTVSPVPLTATMSGNHVLVANMEAKSVLRAVAGSLTKQFAFVDYFPSYEIISAFPFRGTFFETNQRSVNHAGVAHVMKCLFDALGTSGEGASTPAADHRASSKAGERRRTDPRAARKTAAKDADEVVCEEALLAAFAP